MAGLDLDEIAVKDHERILIVDDEADTITLLKTIVRGAGYDVFSAHSGKDALIKCKEMAPDLVLLDLMMPEMDGWDTFRFLREMGDVPVIIVSAIAMKEEVVKAFQLGVDDYLTKPFFNAEVTARIKAVLRRNSRPREISRLVFPKIDLTINLTTQEVFFRGSSIHLTPKEFAILTTLARQAPRIVGYSLISQAVWGEDSEETRKRMKYLVYLLRRKFEAAEDNGDLIVNIDRLGYKLNVD
jgi:two-component system, OmpR family, KDP operon response regulator KdpE